VRAKAARSRTHELWKMMRRQVRRAIRWSPWSAVTADGPSSARYRYASASREDQLGYIQAALERGTLSRLEGRLVDAFESSVARYTGSRRAVAVSSGTAAIQLALASFGVKPGDEIVVPEFSWVSVGGAAAAVGAKVVVAPCQRGLASCWQDIEPLVRPTTAAVVVAHMRGVPALDIGCIADQLEVRGIPLLEDCSQAWGVHLDGRHVGRYGNAGVFSTQEFKLVATGEGGFVITDDDELTDSVNQAAGNPTTSVVGHWAGNARMTELQAAVGLPQLDRLENLIERLIALQSEMLDCLARADGVEQVVPVEAELASRRGRSNGTWVGLWASDAMTARHLAKRLRAAGLAASVGGDTDRHWSEAWPVRVREPLVDPRLWVELPIPDIASRQRDMVLHAAATAVGSLPPARSPGRRARGRGRIREQRSSRKVAN
jgi:dTDP-4-amino-4,6-dideoxygalactose transaminase